MTLPKLSKAQIEALRKFSEPGGHGFGAYAYLPESTALSLARLGLIRVGIMQRDRHRFSWGLITEAGIAHLRALLDAENREVLRQAQANHARFGWTYDEEEILSRGKRWLPTFSPEVPYGFSPRAVPEPRKVSPEISAARKERRERAAADAVANAELLDVLLGVLRRSRERAEMIPTMVDIAYFKKYEHADYAARPRFMFLTKDARKDLALAALKHLLSTGAVTRTAPDKEYGEKHAYYRAV